MTTSAFDGTYRDATVLVTGHTGFKGSWLRAWLTHLGARVVGYSRDMSVNARSRNHLLLGRPAELVEVWGDIRDVARLREVVARHRPSVVFHLAAQPLVRIAYREPVETIDTNVRGTLAVLDAVRRAESVRAVICVTSDKVYRDRDWTWGYRENDRLGGYDPYSASKAMTELAIDSMRSSWGESWSESMTERFAEHPVVIASARAGNVIGGGDFSKYRLVPDLFEALLEKRPFVLRNPASVRPWQFVLEPLSGYLALGARALATGRQDSQSVAGAWNFGPRAEEDVTCERLSERLVELWGEGIVRHADDRPRMHETNVLRLDCAKAAKLLRWRPVYDWEAAAERIVDWYRAYRRRQADPDSTAVADECRAQIERYTRAAMAAGVGWAPRPSGAKDGDPD